MSEKFKYTPTRFMLPTSHYSKKHADYAVAFIENLQHTKGIWAGKPFRLFPWQEQIVRDLFGILKPNGYRQFRQCFVEICKKSGKSELAAAIALFLLCADKEQGAEIYGCACDRQQASVVFDVARDMVMQNAALSRVCKIVNSQKRIIYLPTRSFYVAVSKYVVSKFGINVHGCIFDELLGQTDRKLYDAMLNGADAARKQPLGFVITTAGSDRNSICYTVHQKALDVLEGRKIDPTFYPVVFCAEDEDNWRDPEVWRRVNPSYGQIVDDEYYENFFERAKSDPAEEIQFRQFFLCQWTNSSKRWLPMDKYDKGNIPFKAEDLKGRVCFAGLDLASTDDIAALVLIFPPENEDENFYVLPYFWIPKENLLRRVRKDHVPYDIWERQGFLETTEGNIIHYDFIEQKILELSKKFHIVEILYDRWSAIQMVQNLDGHDFKMTDFGQGFKSMSPPSKELMRIVLDEKFIHGGNPALRWMFDNVFIETDAAGNIKPSKKKSSEKIDGAVATIMALDGAIRRSDKAVESSSSVWVFDGENMYKNNELWIGD
jgi:phage terminase large subunit-like protein